jgi:hypothetical protein
MKALAPARNFGVRRFDAAFFSFGQCPVTENKEKKEERKWRQNRRTPHQ